MEFYQSLNLLSQIPPHICVGYYAKKNFFKLKKYIFLEDISLIFRDFFQRTDTRKRRKREEGDNVLVKLLIRYKILSMHQEF